MADYYFRKFGWTEQEVNNLFEKYGGVCAFCHRPPGKHKLAVDHWHAFDKVKISVSKHENKWAASADSPNGQQHYVYFDQDKKKARKGLKRMLRRDSVRQPICLRCNKALALLEDSKAPCSTIERLENAIKCLKEYEKKVLTKPENMDTIPRCVK